MNSSAEAVRQTTILNIKTFSIVWEIKNLEMNRHRFDRDYEMNSDIFGTKGKEFHLSVAPNRSGHCYYHNDFHDSCITLDVVSLNKHVSKVEGILSLLDDVRDEAFSESFFFHPHCLRSTDGFIFCLTERHFVKDKRLLPGGSLVIKCELTVLDDIATMNHTKFQNSPIQDKHQTLSKDMGQLLEDPSFSDVVLIRMQDQSFKAHKSVLAARSSVFKAMFSHPMRESNTNEVLIEDIQGDVLKAMLRFMYTGAIPDLDFDDTKDLLVAANKYDLEELKEGCALVLGSNISEENVVRLLMFAELNESEVLKNNCFSYIRDTK